MVSVTFTYTSRVSQVHINPQERPVIDTSPKRRYHDQTEQTYWQVSAYLQHLLLSDFSQFISVVIELPAFAFRNGAPAPRPQRLMVEPL